MPKSAIDTYPITFACPQCGQQIQKPLGWVRSNRNMACPTCEADIALDNAEIRATLQQAYKTVAQITGKLRPTRKR